MFEEAIYIRAIKLKPAVFNFLLLSFPDAYEFHFVCWVLLCSQYFPEDTASALNTQNFIRGREKRARRRFINVMIMDFSLFYLFIFFYRVFFLRIIIVLRIVYAVCLLIQEREKASEICVSRNETLVFKCDCFELLIRLENRDALK